MFFFCPRCGVIAWRCCTTLRLTLLPPPLPQTVVLFGRLPEAALAQLAVLEPAQTSLSSTPATGSGRTARLSLHARVARAALRMALAELQRSAPSRPDAERELAAVWSACRARWPDGGGDRGYLLPCDGTNARAGGSGGGAPSPSSPFGAHPLAVVAALLARRLQRRRRRRHAQEQQQQQQQKRSRGGAGGGALEGDVADDGAAARDGSLLYTPFWHAVNLTGSAGETPVAVTCDHDEWAKHEWAEALLLPSRRRSLAPVISARVSAVPRLTSRSSPGNLPPLLNCGSLNKYRLAVHGF